MVWNRACLHQKINNNVFLLYLKPKLRLESVIYGEKCKDSLNSIIKNTCHYKGVPNPIFFMDNARINAYRGLTRLIKESNVQTSKFNEIPAETCEAVYRRILSYIRRCENKDFSIKSPYIFPFSLCLSFFKSPKIYRCVLVAKCCVLVEKPYITFSNIFTKSRHIISFRETWKKFTQFAWIHVFFFHDCKH